MKDLALKEIIMQYPGSKHVFEAHHLDYCCGGKQTLAQACAKRGLVPETLVQEIQNRAQQKEEVIDFNQWSPDLLADYIEKKHHRYVEDTLPHIIEKLERLVHRHGDANPVLMDIQSLFVTIATHLSAHMKKEELVIFPFIRKAVKAMRGQATEMSMGAISTPIQMMENEHEAEGLRLSKIAALTHYYTPPAEACATWQYTYEKLAEFEKDLHMHIHLENNILFPKALTLEKELFPQPASCSINHNRTQP